MSPDARVALRLVARDPGSTPEDVARCLGWYLGGGAWDVARARRLMGRLVAAGRVAWGAGRRGYFPALQPRAGGHDGS